MLVSRVIDRNFHSYRQTHTHTKKKDLGKSKASKTQIKFTTPCNLLDDPGY